jgi:hypothetical protein
MTGSQLKNTKRTYTLQSYLCMKQSVSLWICWKVKRSQKSNTHRLYEQWHILDNSTAPTRRHELISNAKFIAFSILYNWWYIYWLVLCIFAEIMNNKTNKKKIEQHGCLNRTDDVITMEAIEGTSGCVRLELINKWPNSLIATWWTNEAGIWSCWWGETTSLNCSHQWAHSSSPRWYMSMEKHGGMILIEENSWEAGEGNYEFGLTKYLRSYFKSFFNML